VRGTKKDRLHLTVQPSATPIQSSKAGLRADDKPMHLPSVNQWLWQRLAKFRVVYRCGGSVVRLPFSGWSLPATLQHKSGSTINAAG